MTITELNHKNVCILGYGREGQATYAALKHFAPTARITVADSNQNVTIEPGCQLIAGPGYLDKLADFDVVIKSPGIPWHPSEKIAAKLTSATQLFFDSLPKGATTIGITGTKGKSSTANMIYHVLKAAGKPVILAGNIGQPMIGYLEAATSKSFFVLELSSYQLDGLHSSPDIAVITSFFPDHLDYHGSLKEYWSAKANIARHQVATDVVFFNQAYPQCEQMANLSPGRHVGFGADTSMVQAGAHTTASNQAAALDVAAELGLDQDQARHTLETMPGLPHRQESLGLQGGVRWIDDSAATTPQSTISALDTLGIAVDTLIVGGLNREYDFTRLGQRIAASDIASIVLFPETGELVHSAIEAAKPARTITYLKTASMEEAVEWGSRHTAADKICLLSSGAPSYNLFKDFGERGDTFKAAVAALKSA